MSDIEQYILNKLEKLDEKLDSVRDSNVALKNSFDAHMVNDDKMLHNLDSSINRLSEGIDNHSKLLEEYNRQLEIHMKRTDLLENQILPMVHEKYEKETVSKWRSEKWKKVMKVIAAVVTITGAVVGILEVLKLLAIL